MRYSEFLVKMQLQQAMNFASSATANYLGVPMVTYVTPTTANRSAIEDLVRSVKSLDAAIRLMIKNQEEQTLEEQSKKLRR